MHFCWKCLIIKTEMLNENVLLSVCTQWNSLAFLRHWVLFFLQNIVCRLFSHVFWDWKLSVTKKHELHSSLILKVREPISGLMLGSLQPQGKAFKAPRFLPWRQSSTCSLQQAHFVSETAAFGVLKKLWVLLHLSLGFYFIFWILFAYRSKS